MSLTRHAFNNFLRNGWIVFAALESFVEQLDSEIGNLLAGAFRDLFFDLTATELDFWNRAWQQGAAFFQFLVTLRFSPFGNADNFYKIVRGDSGPRFAPQNVIQSRQGTALVVEPIVVEEWVADTPPGETIDNNVELVFGRALGGWAVPGEDTFVESVHLIDDRQLNLQSRVCDRANDFTKTRDDHSFILM